MNQELNFEGTVAIAEIQQAWVHCCQRLRSELGEDIFTSWFGRMELDIVKDATAYIIWTKSTRR